MHLANQVGAGRTSTVWSIREPKFDGFVAKIYNDPPTDLDERFRRLSGLKLDEVWIGSTKGGDPHFPIAAPKRLIRMPADRRVVGIVMVRVPTDKFETLDKFLGTKAARDIGNNLAVSRSLWTSLKELHSCNVVVGDFSAANICVANDGSGNIVFIDVDSYGIVDAVGNVLLPITHVTDNFKAPELQGTLTDTRTDVFTATALTCRLLLGDLNPFAGIPHGTDDEITPQSNIDQGRCWLLHDRGLSLPPRERQSPGLMAFPDLVAERLARGLSPNPQDRPTADQVCASINQLHLTKCDAGHEMYADGVCPQCKFEGSRRQWTVDKLPRTLEKPPWEVPSEHFKSNEAPTAEGKPPGVQLMSVVVWIAIAIALIAFAMFIITVMA